MRHGWLNEDHVGSKVSSASMPTGQCGFAHSMFGLPQDRALGPSITLASTGSPERHKTANRRVGCRSTLVTPECHALPAAYSTQSKPQTQAPNHSEILHIGPTVQPPQPCPSPIAPLFQLTARCLSLSLWASAWRRVPSRSAGSRPNCWPPTWCPAPLDRHSAS